MTEKNGQGKIHPWRLCLASLLLITRITLGLLFQTDKSELRVQTISEICRLSIKLTLAKVERPFMKLLTFLTTLSLLTGCLAAKAETQETVASSQPKTVLIPLPHYGFDPTESAVPWNEIKKAGFKIVFATPDGQPATADVRMVTGADLPAALKKSLMSQPEAVQLYSEMIQSPEFKNPIAWDQIRVQDFDTLLLVGGHDKGMRPYLESPILHRVAAYFFDNNKIVGAICHGTLLAGRSVTEKTDPEVRGRSVLWGRQTTGLTHDQEMVAYELTRAWLGNYYRTYSIPMADELITYLKSPADYTRGPGFPIPIGRDSDQNLKPGYIVVDGNYVSARWPGDAHKFGQAFVKLNQGQNLDSAH